MTETSYIDIVGTEQYFQNKSSSHMSTVETRCEDNWDSSVENSGDYEAYWFTYSEDDYAIPEWRLDDDSLRERRKDANEWLKNNFSLWDSSTGILVLDWDDDLDDTLLGISTFNGANSDDDKTCSVNMWRFSWSRSGYFSEVMEHGTTIHEVLHLYNVYHRHGGIFSDGDSSIMVPASGDLDWCYGNTDDRDTRIEYINTCSRGNARDYIDNW